MTIVVDASCLVELLTAADAAGTVAARLVEDPDALAPHLIDVEVLSAIRRQHRAGELDATAAAQAVDALAEWGGQRVAHAALLERAWALRDSVSAPDAVYVALAEALDVPLVTLDARLARAPGPRCAIEVLA